MAFCSPGFHGLEMVLKEVFYDLIRLCAVLFLESGSGGLLSMHESERKE